MMSKPLNDRLLVPAPTSKQVGESRRLSGLTQTGMAELLGLSGQSRISEYESGKHAMPAALWSLWLLISDQHPKSKAS